VGDDPLTDPLVPGLPDDHVQFWFELYEGGFTLEEIAEHEDEFGIADIHRALGPQGLDMFSTRSGARIQRGGGTPPGASKKLKIEDFVDDATIRRIEEGRATEQDEALMDALAKLEAVWDPTGAIGRVLPRGTLPHQAPGNKRKHIPQSKRQRDQEHEAARYRGAVRRDLSFSEMLNLISAGRRRSSRRK
jgi:hypothetical protein